MFYDREIDLLRFSPSDVIRHRLCARSSSLDLAVALGRHQPPPRDPKHVYARAAERLRQAILEELTISLGADQMLVIEPETRALSDLRAAADKTRAGMEAGVAAIAHAVLWWQASEDLVHHARVDFLVRTATGEYQIMNTTLATRVRAKHRWESGLLALLFEQATGQAAGNPLLVLGSGERQHLDCASMRVALECSVSDFTAFLQAGRVAGGDHPNAHRIAACKVCRFEPECEQRWSARGDLSLVAGIGGDTAATYLEAGFTDMSALAAADEHSPPGQTAPTLWRTHVLQARLQHRAGLESVAPIEIKDQAMLDRLPQPKAGDLYFDIEGYSVPPLQAEYLFGLWDGVTFLPMWAHSPAEEEQLFVRFLTEVAKRRHEHPGLRIYHYNHYEATALRRMALRFQTGQDQVEELCEQVMVDLLPIVRGALLVGRPGYGLKELEVLHGFHRTSSVTSAADSVELYDRWLYEGRDPALLEAIASYNREDVQSTQSLHHWLTSLGSIASRSSKSCSNISQSERDDVAGNR